MKNILEIIKDFSLWISTCCRQETNCHFQGWQQITYVPKVLQFRENLGTDTTFNWLLKKKYEIFVCVGKPTMEKRKILERGGDYLGGFFLNWILNLKIPLSDSPFNRLPRFETSGRVFNRSMALFKVFFLIIIYLFSYAYMKVLWFIRWVIFLWMSRAGIEPGQRILLFTLSTIYLLVLIYCDI